MRFSDIVLSDAELDEIQVAIEEADKKYQEVHGFPMSKGERTITRQNLIREFKEGVWANRDYSPYDEGEPNKGDVGYDY